MVETVLGMTDLQIKLFTAIGQILVAAAVGVIAWRQWRTAQQQAETARKKLISDLFERRVRAYDKLRDVYERIHINDYRSQAPLYEVIRLRQEMRWLFGPKIASVVQETIYPVLANLIAQRELVAKASNLQEHAESSKDLQMAEEEALNIWRGLPELFASSLTLLH